MIALFYTWLGLAISGPFVLLIHRPREALEADQPGSQEAPVRVRPCTGAELAWMVIGVYWIIMTVLLVSIRGRMTSLHTATMGLFPMVGALCLLLAGFRMAGRVDPVVRQRGEERRTRLAQAWTHRAAVGLLATWPVAWGRSHPDRKDAAMTTPADAPPETRGTVYFIGAGPGDPDLITVRGRTLIERCPVCLFAGSLVPRAVVACAPPGALVRNSASMHLDEIIALLAEATAAGRDVARVHSGDPALYGAIAEQIRRLDELGITSAVVPGVSAFQAAAAALRLELTPAGKNQTIILTRAAGNTGVPATEDLGALARHQTGMALYLSAAQMPAVVAALLPHYGPTAPVVVAYRVSWPDQMIFRTTLADVAEQMAAAGITRTALILVGPMLDAEAGGESHLYRKEYSHLFRKSFEEPQRHKDTKKTGTEEGGGHRGNKGHNEEDARE